MNEHNHIDKYDIFGRQDRFLILDGMFFIREQEIKQNTDFVKNTIQHLYDLVTSN